MVTHDGYLVQPAVAVPEDAIDVTINQSGEVLAKLQGQVDLQNVGQLQLAIFPNEAGLGGDRRQSVPRDRRLRRAGDRPAAGARFRQRPAGLPGDLQRQRRREITNLISAQRAYEMNSKVIQAADEMLATISNVR